MTSDARRKKRNSRRPIVSPPSHAYISKHAILCVSALLLLLSPSVAQTSPLPDQSPPFKNFSASTAAIIVILVAALFFLIFFTIYARNTCLDAAPNGSARRRGSFGGSLWRRRRGGGVPLGLDQEAIETFPTLVYSTVTGLKIGKGSLECAICLNEFEDDETLRLLIPRCDHVFHPDCIDAWLASHVTCPVCRANIAPQPGESLRVPELNDSVESRNLPDEEVSVRVIEDPEPPRPPPPVIDSNRPSISLSVRQKLFAKFSESHSTGHSLVQPGENTDRFTLRLPEDVMKEVMSRALNRTMSCVALPREASSRRGYRTGFGEGSSRGWRLTRGLDRLDRMGNSDRWVVSMAPPFFSRATSVRSTKVMAADGEDSTSVESPSFKLEDRKSEVPGPASTDSDRPLV